MKVLFPIESPRPVSFSLIAQRQKGEGNLSIRKSCSQNGSLQEKTREAKHSQSNTQSDIVNDCMHACMNYLTYARFVLLLFNALFSNNCSSLILHSKSKE